MRASFWSCTGRAPITLRMQANFRYAPEHYLLTSPRWIPKLGTGCWRQRQTRNWKWFPESQSKRCLIHPDLTGLVLVLPEELGEPAAAGAHVSTGFERIPTVRGMSEARRWANTVHSANFRALHGVPCTGQPMFSHSMTVFFTTDRLHCSVLVRLRTC